MNQIAPIHESAIRSIALDRLFIPSLTRVFESCYYSGG